MRNEYEIHNIGVKRPHHIFVKSIVTWVRSNYERKGSPGDAAVLGFSAVLGWEAKR
jgi:hypothetical protein